MPSAATSLKRSLILAPAVALTAAIATPAGAAVTKYWDLNGTTPGTGATPTAAWNTNSPFWNTDPTGVAAPTTFATGEAIAFSAGSDAVNAYTVTLNAAYTAGGLTVKDGTVILAGSALTLGASPIAVNNGATLVTPSSSSIVTATGSVYTLDNGTLSDSAASSSFVSANSTITLGAGGGTIDYSNATALSIINPTTVISGIGGLTKTGSSVIALSSVCNYAGPTTINNGELRLRNSTNNNLPVTTALTVNTNGIFNLNQSVNQTVASLSGAGLVGLANGTLTVSGTVSTTFDGSIRDIANAGLLGASTGTGKFIKTGTSTLTLTSNSTYTGTTTVSNGNLVLANPAGLALSGTASIAIGGTLTLGANDQIKDIAPVTLSSGKFATAGFSEGAAGAPGMGALAVTLASSIDFGANPTGSVLAFSTSAVAFANTLKVLNWTPGVVGGLDKLFVGIDGSGIASGSLSKIQFYADGGSVAIGTGATQLATGEIVPFLAPEPATLAALVGVAAIGLVRRRRRGA